MNGQVRHFALIAQLVRNNMFGKNKKAILTTTLIVKVRKYKDHQPYFSLYTTPSMASEEKARATAEKLNELVKLELQEEGWQTEYYAVPMTL